MNGEPLADQDDVEAALLRSLTTTEANFVATLLSQASALLRTAIPGVDTRIAAWPNDPAGLDPTVVASVVAGAVKRYMVNPKGAASLADGVGPYSHSESFASYGKSIGGTGVLVITADDLAQLAPAMGVQVGSIRLGSPMLAQYHPAPPWRCW